MQMYNLLIKFVNYIDLAWMQSWDKKSAIIPHFKERLWGSGSNEKQKNQAYNSKPAPHPTQAPT